MRYIVDETSLSTLGDGASAREHLEALADLLLELRRSREKIAIISSWASVAIGQADVGTYLSTTGPETRDAARLAMQLLDKCDKWDDDDDLYVEPDVRVDDRPWVSFGTALAAQRVGQGRATGCVTLGCSHDEGRHEVSHADGTASVVFVVSPAGRRYLHRQRLEVECPTETDYLAVAAEAFPDLVLSPDLTFRRFEGGYTELRDHVTRHLAALNDRFIRSYAESRGNLDRVGTELGLDVSNEGNTRSSERLMSLRDVVVDGIAYRCEMHTKIERHRNRIHFALTSADEDPQQVVIGIFVSHLTT